MLEYGAYVPGRRFINIACCEEKGLTMISPEFNFDEFIKAVEDEDRVNIVRIAESEYREAEMRVVARGYGKGYVNSVRGFLFFMHEGMKPAGVDEADWQMFRRVCEKLVAKKTFPPGVLKMFDSKE